MGPTLRAVQHMADAGPQDVVLLTVKAHQVKDLLPDLRGLFGPQTMVVTMINGVPWWYFHGIEGAHAGRIVESVDPGGVVTRLLPPARAIGCIVYPAAEVPEPGVIEHTYGDRFTLGEPSGERTPRIAALSEALIAAGRPAEAKPLVARSLALAESMDEQGTLQLQVALVASRSALADGRVEEARRYARSARGLIAAQPRIEPRYREAMARVERDVSVQIR